MLELLRSILKEHRVGIYTIALIHIFILIPSSMVFWFEPDKKLHLVYYITVAAVGAITSIIFKSIVWGKKDVTKRFMAKVEIMLALTAIISSALLLTFYFQTAVFFSNFFEYVYSVEYFGPNRLLSAAIIFVFYNLFFYRDLIRSMRKNKTVEHITPKIGI